MLEVKSMDELRSFLEANDSAVVMFTQPRTCAPCRQLKPHFEAASANSNAAFVVADLDRVPDAVVDFGIRSVPQVMLFTDGNYERHIAGRTAVSILSELD